MDFNILSWLIWVPVAGALVIVALPRDKKDVIKWVAASFTGLQLIFAIVLWMNFDKDFVGLQYYHLMVITLRMQLFSVKLLLIED